MKIEVILRIHDGQNIHGNLPRYINLSKKELVMGCVTSLINSLNLIFDHDILITILDDHSSDELVQNINHLLSHFNHPWNLIHLEKKGFNYSSLKQFEYCRKSIADLVYSVEDDYLHCPSSIKEMIDAYIFLKKHYNFNEVCIFPYDTPQEYDFNPREKYLITRGKYRHWKSSTWTTQTFMTSPKIFKKHWNHFEKLAKEFKVIPRRHKGKILDSDIVWEDTTIGNIWKKEVPVFHPIPSLALHVQFEKEKDPYINHLEWWEKYTQLNKVKKISKFLYN